jgi:hypothetical protein
VLPIEAANECFANFWKKINLEFIRIVKKPRFHEKACILKSNDTVPLISFVTDEGKFRVDGIILDSPMHSPKFAVQKVSLLTYKIKSPSNSVSLGR